MKINLKVVFLSIIFLVFILYGLNYNIFERIFYFNELLSLFGFITFLYYSLSKSLRKFHVPNLKIYTLVLCFLLLGVFHLIVSLFTKTNFYYYFRNSVLVYSAFSFFIGFFFFNYFLAFLKAFRPLLWIIIIVAFITSSPLVLDRYSGAVFFPFLFSYLSTFNALLIFLLNGVYAVRYESLTTILVNIIIGYILTLRRFAYFQALTFIGILCFIAFFIYVSPSLSRYSVNRYNLFGDVHLVYKQHSVLRVDYNSSWRLIAWYRVIVERFPENIIGIGLGTPLFKYTERANSAESENDDTHDAHVTGAHNTYITVFTRLGVAFLLIVFLIYHHVFLEYYTYRSYYKKSGEDRIFLSFFTISVIGLFNVSLESPIYASLYWLMLGLTAMAIYRRQHPLYENA